MLTSNITARIACNTCLDAPLSLSRSTVWFSCLTRSLNPRSKIAQLSISWPCRPTTEFRQRTPKARTYVRMGPGRRGSPWRPLADYVMACGSNSHDDSLAWSPCMMLEQQMWPVSDPRTTDLTSCFESRSGRFMDSCSRSCEQARNAHAAELG